MRRSCRVRVGPAGKTLVSLSILFGGFLLGIGNAVAGLLGSIDHSVHVAVTMQNAPQASVSGEHEHHHHHHASVEAQAVPIAPLVTAGFMEALPAHCLFCLDGITPPPISVLAVELVSTAVLVPEWVDTVTRAAPLSARPSLFDARAPPVLL